MALRGSEQRVTLPHTVIRYEREGLNVAHSSNENKEGDTITKTMDQAANESAPSENGEIQQNTLRPRVLSVSSDEVNYLIYRYVNRS
jgi:hypothetical protein